MKFRLQKLRIVLMAVIVVLIAVQSIWLYKVPSTGGGVVVLALSGSLVALIFDYRRRERERKRDKQKSNHKNGKG